MSKQNPDHDTLPLDFDPPTPRGKGGRPRLGIEPLTTAQRAKRHRDKRKAAPIEALGTPELLRRLARGFRALCDAPDNNDTREAMAAILRELAQRHGIELLSGANLHRGEK